MKPKFKLLLWLCIMAVMAHWIDYNVASQDSNFMETGWMDAIGQSSIPTSFVKAYEYGRMLMTRPDPNYDAIIGTLKDFPYQYNTLPKEIFELGAEACQAKIDLYPWSAKTPKNYFKMAEWYLLAGNKQKARQAMRKVIKALKTKKRGPIERSL